MNNPVTQGLRAMLAAGKDNALLRVTLGKAALDDGQPADALTHLQRATELDSTYSVAWKLLGKAHLALDDTDGARRAWNEGLACAQAKGDAQVVKELTVFLRRLDKQSPSA